VETPKIGAMPGLHALPPKVTDTASWNAWEEGCEIHDSRGRDKNGRKVCYTGTDLDFSKGKQNAIKLACPNQVQFVIEGVWHSTEVTLGADECMLHAFDQFVAESSSPTSVRQLKFEQRDLSVSRSSFCGSTIDTIQGYYTPRHCFYGLQRWRLPDCDSCSSPHR
jgi:hypothetical protein